MEQEKRAGGRRRARWVARAVAAALAAALMGGMGGSAFAAEGTGEGPAALIPVGRAVGIKLFADGVMVVGLASDGEGGGASPARACGLRTGDVITHINSEEVDSVEEVRQLLQEADGQPLTIQATRGDRQIELTATPEETAGGYQLGAWIRDSMAGIGTVTWYDPATGRFAALGHGISDVDTGLIMPLAAGSIMYASVSGVKRGAQGAPGQLQGSFRVDDDLGVLAANTLCGIFGTLTDRSLIQGLEPVEVAARDQVKVGPATVRATVAGEEPRDYQAEIVRVYPGGENGRDLMLRITDPALLEATGGIVQGMSGSPILQDGRLVGAVTHVLIDDPTRGYGILTERMWAAAAG